MQNIAVLLTMVWVATAATFSSSALLSSLDTIAYEFGTSPQTILMVNSGLTICMGLSSFIWNPISTIFGPRKAYFASVLVLVACIILSALPLGGGHEHNVGLPLFVTFRLLGGLQGTFVGVYGQALVSERFSASERGLANGLFGASTALGTYTAPWLGSLFVHKKMSWRWTLGVQVTMLLVGLLPASLALPRVPGARLKGQSARAFNPLNILQYLSYPMILLANLAAGMLIITNIWVISGPRATILHQNHVDVQRAIWLYLLPVVGSMVGNIGGGLIADRTTVRWMKNPAAKPRVLWVLMVLALWLYMLGLCVCCLALSVVHRNFFGTCFVTTLTVCCLQGASCLINSYLSNVRDERTEVLASKFLVTYTFQAIASTEATPYLLHHGIMHHCLVALAPVMLSGLGVFWVGWHGRLMRR